MYQEAFLGIFGIREPAFVASMPVEHACGLWQAWELPDGDYIVQPVDEQYTPLGDSYLLDRMSFLALLTPVAVTMAEDPLPEQKGVLDAASPDLLYHWYSQEAPETRLSSGAVTPKDGSENAGSNEFEDDLESLLDDALAGTPVTVDERLFSSVRRPGGVWPERKEARKAQREYAVENFPLAPETRSKKKSASFMSVLFGLKEAPSLRVSRQYPQESDQAAKQTAPRRDKRDRREDLSSVTTAGDTAVYKTPVPEWPADLAGKMKEEFRLLLEEARDVPQPSLEQKFISLISLDGPFNEEHKHLFSEFGLALRRKRKHYLALAAHKRALGLAPQDEHVLFNVARAEYELGNIEQARNCLEKALALSPAFSSAGNFLAFLNGTSADRENHP